MQKINVVLHRQGLATAYKPLVYALHLKGSQMITRYATFLDKLTDQQEI